MSCTKNPQRFLFFRWFGGHSFKIIRLGRFMHGSDDFVVLYECQKCGAQTTRSFVSEGELLEYGLTIEEIAKARNRIF